MVVIALALALLWPQSIPQQPTPDGEYFRQQAKEKAEAARQAAIHINALADNIHSEADAQNYVDAVADLLLGNNHSAWTATAIRSRVAHAEFAAVSDPAKLIPEQRIADSWNEYVREVVATDEILITVAEVHNLRDAMYTGSRRMWNRDVFPQSLWTAPNIYAIGADGKVANGCRAVEALKIFYDLFSFPQTRQSARDRVQRGAVLSDLVQQRQQGQQGRTGQSPPAKSELGGFREANPVMTAQYNYIQAHGQTDYERLLERLFTELFPED